MHRILELPAVEGISTSMVADGLRLLKDSGLPEETIQSVQYLLVADVCSHCNRAWPRADSPVRQFPPWYLRGRKERKKGPGRPVLFHKMIRMVDEHLDKAALHWTDALTCEECTLAVANTLGAHLMTAPRRVLNSFLRLLLHYIRYQLDEEIAYSWKEERRHEAYTAIYNACFQRLRPQGDKIATLLLIDIATCLRLL